MEVAPMAASCWWLHDQESGIEEAARSGEVEGEIGWDGGGSKNERRWWPRSLIGSHGGIHALRMRGTEAVDLGRHALFRSRSVLELILRNLVELPYEFGR